MGIAASPSAMDAHHVAFLVREWDSSTDLNGDGDSSDAVLHLIDRSTGSVTNTRLAGLSDLMLDDGIVVFRVPELGQGADLNGDGDTSDYVVHVWSASDGSATNLRLAYYGLDLGSAVSEGTVLVAASEGAAGQDLNGDGDRWDHVLHTWSVGGASATNTGMAVDLTILADDGLFAFQVNERSANDTDFNGDGDASDRVLHAWSTTSVNLGWAVPENRRPFDSPQFQVDSGRIAAVVSEAGQGMKDLNGDGDTNEEVLHLWTAADMSSINLGWATYTQFVLADHVLAATVYEAFQGSTDLNGDGDAGDSVLQLYDVPSATKSNTALATGKPLVGSGFVAFSVSETEQGVDLNSDGDTGDHVAHVWDLPSGTPINLGYAGGIGPVLGTTALAAANERSNGLDVNGDGDTDDTILYAWDHAAKAVVMSNMPIFFASILTDGDVAVAVVPESSDGADLNGDGDASDYVLHLWDTASGAITNLALVGGQPGGSHIYASGLLAVGVIEFMQGVDLNGDSDTSDTVLHLVSMVSDPTSDTLREAIEALVAGVFKSPGVAKALKARMVAFDRLSELGRSTEAVTVLLNLRARIDGCGASADADDWIVDCAAQSEIRSIVDDLVASTG